LRTKIRLVEARLDHAAQTFWTHPRLAEMFPEFLVFLHSVIRASVPMLETAAEVSRRLAPDDPAAARLAPYFERHAGEERHHDEWLLDDMEALGLDRSEVLARMPSPTVASFIGAFYYWIHHVHPAALLGYLAVLEGNPPETAQLEEIRLRTGLPAEGFRTMVKHAQLDPHHRDDLDRELDALDLGPELSSLVTVSSFHTVEGVARGLGEILASFS
jgi:hypothetical protein